MRNTLTREFYIPRDAKKTTSGEGFDIYTYTTASGKIAALGFGGKRSKPDFHNSFRTTDDRDSKIARHILNVTDRAAENKKRITERKEFVHHKDGDTSNNKLYNLEIMSNSNHTIYHHKGIPSPLKGRKYPVGYYAPRICVKI